MAGKLGRSLGDLSSPSQTETVLFLIFKAAASYSQNRLVEIGPQLFLLNRALRDAGGDSRVDSLPPIRLCH